MELIADGLLIVTALTAGLYCMVLNRRLRRLTDSRGGIGPQIESLDQALGETRSALAETRQGVSELRGSTSGAIAELVREAARGEEIAQRIERGISDAKATLQRLYEAEGRIDAGESRRAEADGDEKDDPKAGDETGRTEPDTEGGDAASIKVALPEGDVVEVKEGEMKVLEHAADAVDASTEPPSETPSSTGAGQTGPVLKAERVVL